MNGNWQEIIIGTILANPTAYMDTVILKPTDFNANLRPIWKTITKLYDEGSLSQQALIETMREDNILKALGDEHNRGEDYLISLLAYYDDSAFPKAVTEVMDKGIKTELEQYGAILLNEARNGKPAHQIIDEMLDLLVAARRIQLGEARFIGEMLPGFHEKMLRLRSGEKSTGWYSRIQPLNDLLGNVAKSDFIIVAGTGGGGKSSLLRYESLKTIQDGGTVLTFDGENDIDWYLEYALANLSGIPNTKISNPKTMTDEEWDKYAEAKESLQSLPWIILPMAGKSIRDMTFIAKQLDAKYGLDLVQIDQIQNLTETEFEKIETATYEIRNMAHSINIPVMAAHQLNRGVNSNKDRKPSLNSLLYAGDHAAKKVISLWPQTISPIDAERFPENRSAKGTLLPEENRGVFVIKLVVTKNSGGRTGQTTDIAWYRALNDFRPLEDNWRSTSNITQTKTFVPAPKPVKDETKSKRSTGKFSTFQTN